MVLQVLRKSKTAAPKNKSITNEQLQQLFETELKDIYWAEKSID